MSVIVDIQGFKDNNNKFIVKEAAVLSSENRVQHFIFQPPYKFQGLVLSKQKLAKWMQIYHHRFPWNFGFIPYYMLENCIAPLLKNKHIYVKGCEKKNWIRDIFGSDLSVYNMEDDMKCPKLAFLKYRYPNVHRCLIHEGVCALENVLMLEKFLQNCN